MNPESNDPGDQSPEKEHAVPAEVRSDKEIVDQAERDAWKLKTTGPVLYELTPDGQFGEIIGDQIFRIAQDYCKEKGITDPVLRSKVIHVFTNAYLTNKRSETR